MEARLRFALLHQAQTRLERAWSWSGGTVTFQQGLLLSLHAAEEGLRPRDAQAGLNLDKSNVQKMYRLLEQGGLLTRHRRDAHHTEIRLTRAGKATAKQFDEEMDKLDHLFFGDLPIEQRWGLNKALENLKERSP